MTPSSAFTKELDAAIKAARLAGSHQIRELHRERIIEHKGAINLVTEVDKASEAMILEVLQAEFSTHDFLCEETGAHLKGSDYRWIIDPLDGTTNYAHRYPLFCVSIALEYKKEIVVGVVYDPNRDELFTAKRGEGAFLNGKKISVSQTNALSEALLSTGFAYNLREVSNNNIDHFNKMLFKAQSVRRDGVAAIDLCYVACGRYDGFWELGLWPWDVAAGWLIITEAGGQVSRFNGASVTVDDKEILASNAFIHSQISDVLMAR